MTPTAEQAIAETRAWVERAVIGLNLCPFAKGVQSKGQVRYVCSPATGPDELLDALREEIRLLLATPESEVETTLLVHPFVLQDFVDYNDFLDLADAALEELDAEGELQVASFHPDYCFADARPEDVTNATNRSPYPSLHLLRESSVDRAVEAFADPEAIYEANMRTMEELGEAGWAEIQAQCRKDAGTD